MAGLQFDADERRCFSYPGWECHLVSEPFSDHLHRGRNKLFLLCFEDIKDRPGHVEPYPADSAASRHASPPGEKERSTGKMKDPHDDGQTSFS